MMDEHTRKLFYALTALALVALASESTPFDWAEARDNLCTAMANYFQARFRSPTSTGGPPR